MFNVFFLDPISQKRISSPGENAVGRLVRDLDPEGQTVADPHSLDLLLAIVQDSGKEEKTFDLGFFGRS